MNMRNDMNPTYYIDNPDPTLRRLANVAGYNGRRFELRAAESVSCHENYWYEGERSYWTFVRLSDFAAVTLPTQNPLRQAGSFDTPLPAGFAAVENHSGRYSFLRVHVNPANLSRLLPGHSETNLSEDEAIVLLATECLKPSYNGIKDLRFHEANRKFGIDRTRWDCAKSNLIQLRLLNRAGAITAAGRNAIASDPRRHRAF